MTSRLSNWILIGLIVLSLRSLPVTAADSPKSGEIADGNSKFDVLDFQIVGNTVLDEELIEKSVYPFMGPDKTVNDVEQARVALEEAYRKQGYASVVVTVPEQDVVEGAIKLEVLEGQIETVHVTGSRYYALGRIRDGMPSLAEGRVPHMPSVQTEINALAQESSDRSVTPIFRAGSTPGKMEVELRVKDELPIHGNVEINTRSSQNTTLTRTIGSVRYDNLWQKFHSASLQYQVSPENYNEVEVWSGTYVMPTGWADTKLAFYGIGISSNTELGVSVGGSSVVGAGSIYGVRLAKPLASSDDFLQNLTFGADYKDFSQALNLLGQDTGASKISYASFVAGYDNNLRTDSSLSSLNLSAHFSIRGLGNRAEEFEAKRADASTSFLYLTTDIKHRQFLPWDLQLAFRAQGQASAANLISNEQFSAGGPQSVRGYHQTEQLADHGVNLSMELYSPRLLPSDWEAAQNFRALGFIDWAGLWTNNPIAPTPAYTELASAGLGLRMQLFKKLTGELDWGYPLYRQNSVNVGQQRIDFRMAYEF